MRFLARRQGRGGCLAPFYGRQLFLDTDAADPGVAHARRESTDAPRRLVELYAAPVDVGDEIPLRIGVDEGGTGKVASLLGLTRTTGVTLAIVRKARDICWTAIGIALIVRRGISLRAAAGQSEEIMEELSSDDALTVSAGKSG